MEPRTGQTSTDNDSEGEKRQYSTSGKTQRRLSARERDVLYSLARQGVPAGQVVPSDDAATELGETRRASLAKHARRSSSLVGADWASDILGISSQGPSSQGQVTSGNGRSSEGSQVSEPIISEPIDTLIAQSEYFRDIPFPNTPIPPGTPLPFPPSADGFRAQQMASMPRSRPPGQRQERTASLAFPYGVLPLDPTDHPPNPQTPTFREARNASLSQITAPLPSPLNIAPAMQRIPATVIQHGTNQGLTQQAFNPSFAGPESSAASTPTSSKYTRTHF
ncbi:hypothetical protein BC830DRAFT_1167246, partial [Chytriomyces sp. MP71]